MAPLPDQSVASNALASAVAGAAGGWSAPGVAAAATLAAAAATLAAGPLVRRIAIAHALYDRPDHGLKPHERPIPYLGGLALYAGWLAALLLSLALVPQGRSERVGLLACASVLLLTGLIDDVRHLRPATRLCMQGVVALVLLFAGIGRSVAPALLDPFVESLPQTLTGGGLGLGLSAVFCAAVLAGAVNATNLIDGLDGLCAGILAIAAGGFLVVRGLLPHPATAGAEELMILVVSAGLLGACVAFLRFNFNPASLFMGDSGSMLLGFCVAAMLIRFTELASWRGLLAGLAVFGFPVFDTALAVGRRMLNGRPLFVGDRSHFYDQLRDRGLSVRRTVLVCYGLAAIFALLGAVMTRLPAGLLWAVCAVLPLIAAVTCWRGGFLRVDDSAERSRGAGV